MRRNPIDINANSQEKEKKYIGVLVHSTLHRKRSGRLEWPTVMTKNHAKSCFVLFALTTGNANDVKILINCWQKFYQRRRFGEQVGGWQGRVKGNAGGRAGGWGVGRRGDRQLGQWSIIVSVTKYCMMNYVHLITL